MALVLLVSEKEMMTVLVRVLRRDNVKGNMCSEPQKDSLLVRLKGGVDRVREVNNTLCIFKKSALHGILCRRKCGLPNFWRVHRKLENQMIILSRCGAILNDGSNITTSSYIVGSLVGWRVGAREGDSRGALFQKESIIRKNIPSKFRDGIRSYFVGSKLGSYEGLWDG